MNLPRHIFPTRIFLGGALLALILASVGCADRSQDRAFYKVVDEAMDEHLTLHPETRSYLGMKEDNHRWDDYSLQFDEAEHQRTLEALEQLGSIDATQLTDLAAGQHEIISYSLNQTARDHDWRFHRYSITQMFSPIDNKVAFLINVHGIDSRADAEAYIARIKNLPQAISDILAQVKAKAKKGIHPPDFVYPKVIENTRLLVEGTSLQDNFISKIEALDLPAKERQKLEADLDTALARHLLPALDDYMRVLKSLQPSTTAEHGVWKLPRGREFYQQQLKSFTTTDYTADYIHEQGLMEVVRLHEEMKTVQRQIGFEGDLGEFFDYMRTNDRWYYPEEEASRDAYLAASEAALERIREKIPLYFNRQPKSKVIVKRVEAFREKNTSAAFYNAPSLDGSRPGIYYVPLYRMRDNATWDLMTTAYHETLPGHHMQIAIAMELPDTPLLLKLVRFGAYVEGWALYAETLAAEMGMYEGDPGGKFGQLAAELFRAVRLVVDTGIHHRAWTRQEAIDYMVSNTAQPIGYATGEIERYIVWPGQATSYKVGQMKILELREMARNALGDDFDIRDFHDVVLTSGEIPLVIMEKRVKQWVDSVRG